MDHSRCHLPLLHLKIASVFTYCSPTGDFFVHLDMGVCTSSGTNVIDHKLQIRYDQRAHTHKVEKSSLWIMFVILSSLLQACVVLLACL